MSNNPLFRTIDLDEKTFNFIIENCESNITYGLMTLQSMQSKDLIEIMIDKIESFKKVRQILKDAK